MIVQRAIAHVPSTRMAPQRLPGSPRAGCQTIFSQMQARLHPTSVTPRFRRMLPCSQWQAENEAECSLCMDVFQKHETIMRLPCSHAFHQSCCRKWLVEAQKYKPRRCPLCNSDPLATRHLETVAVAAPVVASDAASQVEIGQSPAASPMGV